MFFFMLYSIFFVGSLGGGLNALMTSVSRQEISCGQVLITRLLSGANINVYDDQDSYLRDIVSIVWYLDSCAEKKKQSFTHGMYRIEDPDGLLFNFLYQYPGVYARRSSHFREYAITQYGIDIPKRLRDSSSPILLPHSQYHILFGRTDDGYLFIEPEKYGTSWRDIVGHTKEYLYHLVHKKIPGGLDRSDYRHEFVPYAVKKRWKKVLSEVAVDSDTMKRYVYDGVRFGIKRMVALIDVLKQEHATTDEQHVFLDNFHTYIHAEYDHAHVRKGREVLFVVSDFMADSSVSAW